MINSYHKIPYENDQLPGSSCDHRNVEHLGQPTSLQEQILGLAISKYTNYLLQIISKMLINVCQPSAIFRNSLHMCGIQH